MRTGRIHPWTRDEGESIDDLAGINMDREEIGVSYK
jgi:hypothetical protein